MKRRKNTFRKKSMKRRKKNVRYGGAPGRYDHLPDMDREGLASSIIDEIREVPPSGVVDTRVVADNILRIGTSETRLTRKDAFRFLALHTHPDKVTSEGAQQAFQMLNDALETFLVEEHNAPPAAEVVPPAAEVVPPAAEVVPELRRRRRPSRRASRRPERSTAGKVADGCCATGVGIGAVGACCCVHDCVCGCCSDCLYSNNPQYHIGNYQDGCVDQVTTALGLHHPLPFDHDPGLWTAFNPGVMDKGCFGYS